MRQQILKSLVFLIIDILNDQLTYEKVLKSKHLI